MEGELTSVFKTTVDAPVDGIVPCVPNMCADASKCEVILQIGIFFDGTDNNKARDEGAFGDTNVVRLWKAYKEEDSKSIYKLYIPGVGTPFPEIGEKGTSTFGTAFGSGCYARILYAFLWFANTVSLTLSDRLLFSSSNVIDLISNELKSDSDNFGRRAFMLDQCKRIERIQEESHVKMAECFVDIFGFSRGAAQARVFSTWLIDLLRNGKLAGIPLVNRFLGIFDTVASAGVTGSIGNAVVNSTGGHTGWAEAKFLRIRKEVKNCVHMVAMHEIRKNFPLDEVSISGTVPANCQEFAYPGAHSDVGGGYKPGQLGIASDNDLADGDRRKLSQIPLQHMLACAIAAGVPMVRKADARLEVHADVEKAYKYFLSSGNGATLKLSDWMLPYLAWRLQVFKNYENLTHVRQADGEDRELLIGGNNTLVRDAQRLGFKGDSEVAAKFVKLARSIKNFDLKSTEYRQDEISAFDPEASYVLEKAQSYPPVSEQLAKFFDTFIHDSLAGFRKDLKEPTGYWRFRRSFRGGDQPGLAKNDSSGKTSRAA